MTSRDLINIAIDARNNAYAPYSGFQVGAALLAENGKVYTGVNVENSSFGATSCAERNAFFKAIGEGCTNFISIAIVGGKGEDYKHSCPPCGICRQVMREFCKSNFQIIMFDDFGGILEINLDELFPFAFGPDNL